MNETPAPSKRPSPAAGASGVRGVWWWIALSLALLPTVLSVVHLRRDDWGVCEHVVAKVGRDAVAVACRPPKATDFVTVVLPIGVLLFPHVAELTIPGVISLKKRVERHEQVQGALERQMTRVQQQVSQSLRVVNVLSFEDLANGATDFEEGT